jgi:hypothetical protein
MEGNKEKRQVETESGITYDGTIIRHKKVLERGVREERQMKT